MSFFSGTFTKQINFTIINTIGSGTMRNKKGFVFVETLVVVAVLTASLLMLYSTYSAIVRKEKTRITYNDSAYLYRTYYLEKFFRNFRMDSMTLSLNKDNPDKPIALLTGFGCTNNIFINEEDNKGLCENLLAELHVSNMYLTYNDLSILQTCTNQSGPCEALVQVNETASAYLKTIGGDGKEGYRIIIEYAETKEGEACVGDDCRFYYATISLGELS